MIIPWKVDVPQDRLPFLNWLIITGAVVIFIFQSLSIWERSYQLPDKMVEYKDRSIEDVAKDFGVDEKHLKEIEQAVEKATGGIGGGISKKDITSDFKEMLVKEAILKEYFVQAKIRPFILNGWSITGLFGHIWLHEGILHIVGNMLFLWIFGNAVCSKIGNIIYLPIYVLLGLAAGISQNIFVGGSGLGASGAINGIVGMYLVFFPLNEITCYFLMIFLLRPYVKEFSLSSYWMILFWLAFDIWGAMQGGGRVAYFAHLGGFAGGAILAILMLKFKLVKMESDEKSLLQIISEFGKPVSADEFKPHYEGYLELIQNEAMNQPAKAVIDSPEPRTISLDPPIPVIPPPIPKAAPPIPKSSPQIPKDDFIRFACPCGKRLKIPAKFAGKMGKCPQCQNRVKIPDK